MKKTTASTKQLVIDTEGASHELTGVRKAAIAANHWMAALERQAEDVHAKTLLSCTARVVSTKEGGIHALITDDRGVTVEISGGELCAAIAPKE
jgi:hypothetical protein